VLLVFAAVIAGLYVRMGTGAPVAMGRGPFVLPLNTGVTTTATAEILSEINRPAIESAKRDPFMAVQAIPAQPPASVQKMTALPPPPEPAPAPPPVGLTFVGRLVGPEGDLSIMANNGNETLTLRPGQALPNGYRVDAVNDQAVLLSYPPLNTTARLDLPSAPQWETR
jgi:hypothetical protein